MSDGSHTVTATVIDGIGKTSNRIIHVITDGTKPIGRILSIADGQTVHVPAIKISGSAFDVTSGIKKIEIQIDSNAFQIASGTTAWTFDTASLLDGTHSVKIRVTDNAGNVFTGLAITFAVRTAPTGLTAIALGENKIGLIWTSQILETGSIAGYKIERESPRWRLACVIVSNTGNMLTEYTDTGLTAGTVYNYRVYAIFADHTSPPSNSVSATTSVITLPRSKKLQNIR
ncbi:MAG: Ig-like domain-containing protein [Nitrosotalea sp.]